MKLWQKIALGSTALIAATVLAACGKSSNSDSSSSTKTTGTVKLWVDTTQVSYFKSIVKKIQQGISRRYRQGYAEPERFS